MVLKGSVSLTYDMANELLEGGQIFFFFWQMNMAKKGRR